MTIARKERNLYYLHIAGQRDCAEATATFLMESTIDATATDGPMACSCSDAPVCCCFLSIQSSSGSSLNTVSVNRIYP
jgi:hypothetical protein